MKLYVHIVECLCYFGLLIEFRWMRVGVVYRKSIYRHFLTDIKLTFFRPHMDLFFILLSMYLRIPYCSNLFSVHTNITPLNL